METWEQGHLVAFSQAVPKNKVNILGRLQVKRAGKAWDKGSYLAPNVTSNVTVGIVFIQIIWYNPEIPFQHM